MRKGKTIARYSTDNCVRCLGARAVTFTGHVWKGKDKRVLAGFCKKCMESLQSSADRWRKSHRLEEFNVGTFLACDWSGWNGHWVEEMGLRPCDELGFPTFKKEEQ